MVRSNPLITLVRAAIGGDKSALRSALESLIADERSKKHHMLADKLAENLPYLSSAPFEIADERTRSLFHELVPRKKLDELILPFSIRNMIDELIEEQHKAGLLHEHGLKPRHRILFAGLPGNGKTSLAEAIAMQLTVPMVIIRYEALVRNYLGETASRLAAIMEYVSMRPCVLFFDEFEIIGKEHGNARESGEMKKIVSSLLLQIDRLPSHVVVIAANSYPELLDRIVLQKFQLKIELPSPKRSDIEEYLGAFRQRVHINFGYSDKAISEQLSGFSFSEIEEFCMDVTRHAVLEGKADNAKDIAGRKLKQWQDRYKILSDIFHVSEIRMHAIKPELPGSTVEAIISDMDQMT